MPLGPRSARSLIETDAKAATANAWLAKLSAQGAQETGLYPCPSLALATPPAPFSGRDRCGETMIEARIAFLVR